jgi:hypothetical protein
MAWIKSVWLAVYLYFAGKSIDWVDLLQLAEDTLDVLRDGAKTAAEKYDAFLRFMDALKPLLPTVAQSMNLRSNARLIGSPSIDETPESLIAEIHKHVDARLMATNPVQFDGSILLAFMRLIQLLWPLIQAAI